MASFEWPRLSPLGDSALVVEFGDEIDEATNLRATAFADLLEAERLADVVETVTSFVGVTLLYDLLGCSYEELRAQVEQLLEAMPNEAEQVESRSVEIPVCYGGELGPDLEWVADHNDLSADEVVSIHCEPTYRVYMVGFVPGFPYLGGTSERIRAPRLESPRGRVPAGSVGIAGEQTGVYPVESPGGWRLIGRTPMRLFDPNREPPAMMTAGDSVRFTAIERNEYERLLTEKSTC